MKKWVSMILAPMVALGFCACGTSTESSVKELEAGFGRVDITPSYPVAMAGSASTRVSEGVMDPLYFTCIALRMGEETFLVATMDLVGTYQEFADPARTHIS